MAKFEKGNEVGRGRPKGAKNRTTEEAKSIINRIVDKSLTWAEEDIEKLRKKDPIQAFQLAMKLMEYAYPKLKSVEMKAEIDNKISQINVTITQKKIDEPRD
jgi:hypothetical protein